MDLTSLDGAFTSKATFFGKTDVEVQAAVDTGSDVNFLDEEKCLEIEMSPDGSRSVLCVHGKRENMFVFKGKVRIADKTVESRVVALPTGTVILPGTDTKAVVGRTTLKEFVLHLDGPKAMGSIESP